MIHGLVDPLVMPSGGIATARAVPGSRLLMFPDMGHDLPRPRWDEIIDAILANIRRATPASPLTPRGRRFPQAFSSARTISRTGIGDGTYR